MHAKNAGLTTKPSPLAGEGRVRRKGFRGRTHVQTGLVVGTATATRKHPTLMAQSSWSCKRYVADGRTPDGEPILAVDRLSAGRGETVIITSDGRFTRELLKSDNTPVRWSVIGLKNT